MWRRWSGIKYEVLIRLECNDERLTSAIYTSLKPEEELRMKSIKMVVDKHHDTVAIHIEAQDVTSMRIATNSLLRLISLVLNVLNTLQLKR